MAAETIVLTPGRDLPPDVMTFAQQHTPAGFRLHTVPGGASAAEIGAAMRDVVDEEALLAALRSGRILAAGLDTLEQEPTDPQNPLLALPNVTLTPHIAGPTIDSFAKRFRNGYANIVRVASGQPPLWVIPEMRDLFPA